MGGGGVIVAVSVSMQYNGCSIASYFIRQIVEITVSHCQAKIVVTDFY